MKKSGIAAVLFVLTFVASYLICSFCIPGWRIKLEADAMTVFVETLKILMPVKLLISLAAGGIIGALPFFVCKK